MEIPAESQTGTSEAGHFPRVEGVGQHEKGGSGKYRQSCCMDKNPELPTLAMSSSAMTANGRCCVVAVCRVLPQVTKACVLNTDRPRTAPEQCALKLSKNALRQALSANSLLP